MSQPDDKDPPKLPLLIKFMGMTGSSHDGEALAALRKANSLLASAGWSWERLLNGKVTVIADPFQSIPEPAVAPARARTGASAPPPRQAYAPNPPPPPPKPSRPQSIFRSTRSNSYAGHCWCCGTFVAPGDGFILSGQDILAANPKATSAKKWETICHTHNNASTYVPARRAGKQTPSSSTILGAI